ncbi:MAG TPA: AsmA family protein [Alphaproteobacteria bacterium]|nr:AsmA family protein [Alphaproteobacteria bacterium]
MRRLKWVLTGIVVLLVAVIVAGVAILKSLDLNQYRDLIAREIEGATGRKVVIGGPIDLEVSLSPALALSDVSLANAPWATDPQMLAVKRFEAKVALLPLLSKQVQIVRIVLSGADIRLETNANGEGNWVFKQDQAPEPEPAPAGEEAQGEAVIPAFDEVTVEDSRVSYRDGQSGQVTTAAVVKLEASAPSQNQPLEIDFTGSYNDNPIEVMGTLGPMASLIAGEPVAVDLEAKAGGATVRLIGDLGKPGTEKGSNLVISAEGGQVGELSNFAGAPIPALGPYKASLRLQETKGVFSAEAIQAVLGSEALMLASATGSIANLVAVDGIDLRIELKGPSLAALNEPAKLELPPVGPYQIGAAVKGGLKKLRLEDFAATVGSSDLAGSAALALGDPRPAVEASLTSNKLVLADFTGPPKEGATAGTSAKSSDGRIFPADPLPFEGLQAVDGTVQLSTRSLVLEQVTMENVSVAATIKNGRLTLDPLKAGISGGTVAIKADIDGAKAKPPVALSVISRQVEVGSLLRLLQVSDVLSGGKADLDLNVTGQGESVRAIMAGLNGSSRLVMGPGRIDNRFAKILLADLGGIITLSGSSDSSNINCMVSDFAIAAGQAKATALVLDTNGATIVGSGGINLATEGLNLRFDPNAKQTSLAKLAVPVQVRGTLASPSVTPDPAAIAKGAVGAVVGAPSGIFGALAGLTGSKASTAEQNPCAAALTGKTQPSKAATETSSGTAPATGTGVVEDAVKGLGKTLDNFFGGSD